MKKLFLFSFILAALETNAQIKVISGGNVGVGTTSPQTIFHVHNSTGTTLAKTLQLTNSTTGSTTTDGFIIRSGSASGNDVELVNQESGKLSLYTNNSERLTILSGGNIGINNITPPARLTIYSSKTNSTGISVKNYDVDLILTQDSATNGGKIQVMSGGNSSTIGATPYRLLIQPEGGYVGIGTTSPNNLIQVAGLINFNNTLLNTFLGSSCGAANTTGENNTYIGYQSGLTNTTGSNNTYTGYLSGKLSTASTNTFYGSQTGVNTSTGESNTFSGCQAGYSNTTAGYNVFSGYKAGYSNTSGQNNTFTGYKAGYSNTTSHYNSFYGTLSGLYNTGNYNTFIGHAAGLNNTVGYNNTFTGYEAGQYNTTGYDNTFIGYYTGSSNSTGDYNTYIGYSANANGNYNNATAIGSNAVVTASNHIMIGNSTVTEIGGYASWTNYSDGRFKTNVQENVKGLAFIMKLRPVTYQLNTQQLDAFIKQNMPQQTDSSGNPAAIPAGNFSESMAIVHSGFIAQEVEQAEIETGFTSSIVSKPSNDNDAYSLAYGEIVVPLVKAVQELNNTIDSLKTLQKTSDNLIADLQQQINNCCTTGSTKDMMINSSSSNTGSESSRSAYLMQNVPNPFSTKTVIRYYIPENIISAKLMIFDMHGKLIKTYPVSNKKEGYTEINGGEMQPGMYMYSLIIDGKELDTKRMILTE